MNENKKKIKYVKCIIAIICCIIIFSFSAVPATASTKQSKGVTYNVIKLLNGNKLSERDLEKLTKKINPVIRKIAHFSIYTCL